MLEEEYQVELVGRIESLFPGCRIVHNKPRHPGYTQGFPDLTIFYQGHYAYLEVKRSARSAKQPNQQYYIDLLSQETFARFIFPENEEEVLDALQNAFASCERSR